MKNKVKKVVIKNNKEIFFKSKPRSKGVKGDITVGTKRIVSGKQD